jgi:hypothetical protein
MLLDFLLVFLFVGVWLGACFYMIEQAARDKTNHKL